jgi:hypothetical protein
MFCSCLFTLSPGNAMLTPLLPISPLVVKAFARESSTTTSTPSTRSLWPHATHRNLIRNRDRTTTRYRIFSFRTIFGETVPL